MENILVMFGGESTEHDISIISALQAMENLDKTKYNIMPFYIDKQGNFLAGKLLNDIKFLKNINYSKADKVYFKPNSNYLYAKGKFKEKKVFKIDVAIPIFHGKNGEDGVVQGMLKLSKIPFACCGILGLSVGMDKIVQKHIFKALNIPIIDFFWFDKKEYELNKQSILNNNDFDFPKIVKPCNLGSSIGINIANSKEELMQAIEIALHFDNKIIVEKALTDFKEINIALLKKYDEILFSDIEQPKNWKKFLDFDEKYMSNIKSNKLNKDKKKIKVSEKLLKTIKDYSNKVYKLLDAQGTVRFDYIYDKKDKKIYLNEINTIPGSLSFYLWKNHNLEYKDLLNILIEQAKYESLQEKQISTIYISDVLNLSSKGVKK